MSRGAVFSVGSHNTIAVSNGRVIALCGVRDLVVVETADAVLVCHRDSVQDMKKLLPLLPEAHPIAEPAERRPHPMLQSLRIRNLALLESVSVDFEPGFTAVTGETGRRERAS